MYKCALLSNDRAESDNNCAGTAQFYWRCILALTLRVFRECSRIIVPSIRSKKAPWMTILVPYPLN